MFFFNTLMLSPIEYLMHWYVTSKKKKSVLCVCASKCFPFFFCVSVLDPAVFNRSCQRCCTMLVKAEVETEHLKALPKKKNVMRLVDCINVCVLSGRTDKSSDCNIWVSLYVHFQARVIISMHLLYLHCFLLRVWYLHIEIIVITLQTCLILMYYHSPPHLQQQKTNNLAVVKAE